MKIYELVEADNRPIQRKAGKLIDIMGDAEIAPEIMDKFKEQVRQMSPEDQQKVRDMGGIKPFWNDFKTNGTYTLELYRDRGVLTMKHPVIGRLATTVNMNVDDLENGNVSITGASATATTPGHSRTTTTRANQQDFDRARAAADTELTRQGIDPTTGTRR